MKFFLFTAGAMACYAIGEICSKWYANSFQMKFAVWAVLLYTITSALWLPVLRIKNQLAILTTIWTLLYAVIGVSLGILMFGEKISTFNMIGIVMAMISIIFLCL